MKIELEIDDKWKDEELCLITLYELLAVRLPGETWKVKTSSCNQCGKCCYSVSENFPFKIEADGKCEFLKNNICSLGTHRPVSCLLGFHGPTDKPDYCTEIFKEI